MKNDREERRPGATEDPYADWPESLKGEPFWPHHVIKQVVQALLLVGVLITLVTFFPHAMEPRADPFSTPEHIKPEWYFLPAYQALKLAEKLSFLGAWAPKLIGIMGQGVVVLLLLLVPFLDRGGERNPLRRPIAMILGGGLILTAVGLGLWGRFS